MQSFQDDIDAIQSIEAVPKILEVVCRTTGMGFAAVARVTEDRWICCAVRDEISFGLPPGGELKVESTLCHEIRQSRDAIVIDHVANDALYCSHHTPAQYGFQSYISMPILRADGTMFGTLCAIDPHPRKLNNPEVIGMFKLFAELISFHLDAVEKLDESRTLLAGARKTAEVREQFLAVLGHDLRNPLASIAAGGHMLRQQERSDDDLQILDLMQSSVNRMSTLLDNVQDFARGQLGGSLPLRKTDVFLEPSFYRVTSESRAKSDRQVNCKFELSESVNCDADRIAQLYAILLGNALAHGNGAVSVTAKSADGGLELSVSNAGDPIPPEIRERLFQPFSKGRGSRSGVGLGLYIAAEIARAHGGTLEASSTADETRFTFKM